MSWTVTAIQEFQLVVFLEGLDMTLFLVGALFLDEFDSSFKSNGQWIIFLRNGYILAVVVARIDRNGRHRW